MADVTSCTSKPSAGRTGCSFRRKCAIAALMLPIAAISGAARAEGSGADGFDLGVSSRLRYETVDGQARPGFNANDALIDLRTIVTAGYGAGRVRFGAELYDSRSWLANARTPLTTNEVNSLELVQAWAAIDIAQPFGAGTSLTLQGGRMLINLGSRRLVAADDYRNTTNANTGLRVDLGLKAFKATLIYVLPQQRRPDDLTGLLDNRPQFDHEGFDEVLWGGVLTRGHAIAGANAEVSYYHFGEHDMPGRPTRDRSLDTVSVRLVRPPAPNAVDYDVEGIYQTGRVSASAAAAAPSSGVAAWFTHASAGFSLAAGWRPRMALEFDIASGDRPGGRNNRFDSLFGMRRADLGPVGVYNVVSRSNVLSPGIRLEATPDKRWDLMLNYRALWLASATDSFGATAVRDTSGRSGRFAGHQVDARVRAWIVPQHLRFEVDAVWLAKGRFLETAPNAPRDGDSDYLSLNLTAML